MSDRSRIVSARSSQNFFGGAHRLIVWAWREAAGIINGPLIRVVAMGGRRDEAPARHEQHHA
jgi:hypothetical protein